jgi:putative Mn2+ efflux pump MntP
MSLIEILLIAVGLAMDAFAVSLGAATGGFASGYRAIFRLAFHFGLFQFLMPVIGFALGSTIAPVIASADHWIAFVLLSFIGARMIRSGFDADGSSFQTNPTRGATLVMLSVATSVDALAVGLSLAFLNVTIWYPSIIIGVVAATFSLGGIKLGQRLGEAFGKRMEIFGGGVLILIGLRILVEHLM